MRSLGAFPSTQYPTSWMTRIVSTRELLSRQSQCSTTLTCLSPLVPASSLQLSFWCYSKYKFSFFKSAPVPRGFHSHLNALPSHRGLRPVVMNQILGEGTNATPFPHQPAQGPFGGNLYDAADAPICSRQPGRESVDIQGVSYILPVCLTRACRVLD